MNLGGIKVTATTVAVLVLAWLLLRRKPAATDHVEVTVGNVEILS